MAPDIPEQVVTEAIAAIKENSHTNAVAKIMLRFGILVIFLVFDIGAYASLNFALGFAGVPNPQIIALAISAVFMFVVLVPHLRNIFKGGVQE